MNTEDSTTMKTKAHKFQLVKFYADGRPPEVVKCGLTEDQAHSACNAPSTRKAGEWFIGYRETNAAFELGETSPRRGTASITKALLANHHGLAAGRANFGQYNTF